MSAQERLLRWTGLWVVLVIALSACNMPGFRGATTPTLDVSVLTLPPGITPAYTETPITPGPTPTLEPGVTPTATVCTYWVGFVEDVTIPDGTEFVAGTTFEKTWRVRSNGCIPWPSGTVLVFDQGDSMSGPANVPVPDTALGSTVDVSVTLTAPSTPGDYIGYWQLQAPGGIRFGPHVFVQITVIPATPTPTATPTATPTPTPSLPDLRASDLTIPSTALIAGTNFNVSAIVHNDGPFALNDVVVRLENHIVAPHTTCADPGMLLHEATVDLNAGQSLVGNFPVRIDTAGHHFLCIELDPANAVVEADEDNNSQGEEVAVGTRVAIALEPGNTGSVREGGVADLSYAQPGDNNTNQRVHGFLSWNLSTIPAGVEILYADITWNTSCFHGGSSGSCTGDRDPFPTLGALSVRAYYYGTLDGGDFSAAGLSGGTLLASYTAQLTGQLDVTDAVADAHAAGHPFQVYALFEYGSNDNGYFDGVRFPEGSLENLLTVIYAP